MRIFLSSTSYDLFDLRAHTVSVIQQMGHEAVFHESPTFPALLNAHSHDQCLEAVQRVDLVLCLVDRRYGGRYAGKGSAFSEDQRIAVRGTDRRGNKKSFSVIVKAGDLSITWMELIAAYKTGIPVVTFARQRTLDEKETRRSNQFLQTFRPSYAEKNELFDMLDWITKQSANNWITSFQTIVDYDQKLKTWVGELGRTITPPDNEESAAAPPIAASSRPDRFVIIVEGEVDRLFVTEMLLMMKLSAHFVTIPAYGKRNITNSFPTVVAPYAQIFREVLVLVDSDTLDEKDSRRQLNQIAKLAKASRLENVKAFVATPSIEAWIAAGLEQFEALEQVGKYEFKRNFGPTSINHIRNLLRRGFRLDVALERNPEFRAFYDHVRGLSNGLNNNSITNGPLERALTPPFHGLNE